MNDDGIIRETSYDLEGLFAADLPATGGRHRMTVWGGEMTTRHPMPDDDCLDILRDSMRDDDQTDDDDIMQDTCAWDNFGIDITDDDHADWLDRMRYWDDDRPTGA